MLVLRPYRSFPVLLHPVSFDGILDGMRKNENTAYRQKPLKAMSDNGLRDLLPQSKQYKRFLGAGLYILVRVNGSKYWRLDYRFNGKRNTLSLGVYPDVTLDQAIELRDKNLAILKTNIDPKDQFLKNKQLLKDQQARQLKPARFLIDHDGNLYIKLGHRAVTLTPSEATELHKFLNSTQAVSLSEV